jgi:hypothetical protein
MVADYDGTTAAGGGTQESFFRAQSFAADPTTHVVLTGSAPPGAVLRLSKGFQTATQEPSPASVPERLNTTLVVPANGQFVWHVNQSTRPIAEQEGKTEAWTLTCERPEGTVRLTQSLVIDRGQTRALSLRACAASAGGGGPGGGTPPPAEGRSLPRVAMRLAATYNGRRYRVRVRGSLLGPGDDGLVSSFRGRTCAGTVALRLTGRKRRLASKRIEPDGECGFEHVFSMKRSKLPRALRRSRRRLRSVTVRAQFGGGAQLRPAQRSRTVRVRKR